MLTCKTGDWWEENPQEERSNNSAVLLRHKLTKDVFKNLWNWLRMVVLVSQDYS
jgi:ribonucleoside-diphosphate reductase alpha chain